MSQDTVDVRPEPPPRTPDSVLNALLLELSKDPEIAPYLRQVIPVLEVFPAARSLDYLDRVIKAYDLVREVVP